MLQETKMQQVDIMFIRSIWWSRFKDWEFIQSIGAFGGILIVWNAHKASKVDSLEGDFLSVLLDFHGIGN